MISTQKITKYFGSFKALRDISFEINKGEIVGFLGRNGAGKTTLMRILTSYIPPDSGLVSVAGHDVLKNFLATRREIGYLPEVPPLYPNMTVKDYLRLSARLKDIPSNRCSVQIDQAISQCSLSGVKNKIIAQLSKGYKQRVGIAQAIINDPAVLILDEPTSGLDPIQIAEVRCLIKNLETRRTVLLSTHILSEIEQIAKRVIILKSGRIVADKPLREFLENYAGNRKIFLRIKGDRGLIEQAVNGMNNYRQVKIDSSDGVHFMELEIAAQSRPDNLNELIKGVLKIGAGILEITDARPGLEQAFFNLHSDGQ